MDNNLEFFSPTLILQRGAKNSSSLAMPTSWQIEGEKVEGVTDFIFLGSKITADGDCSHEIKRRLLLERKVTNLDQPR